MFLQAAETENAHSNLWEGRFGEPVRACGIEDSRSQSVARAVKNAYVEKLVRWQSLAFPFPLYVPSRAGLVLHVDAWPEGGTIKRSRCRQA